MIQRQTVTPKVTLHNVAARFFLNGDGGGGGDGRSGSSDSDYPEEGCDGKYKINFAKRRPKLPPPPFFAYAPLRTLFFLRAIVFMFWVPGLASPPLPPLKKDGPYG